MFKKEIIGKELKVVDSKNESLEGTAGKIIDETRSSIVISSQGRRKTILKQGSQFQIGNDFIHGDDFVARPEDRIKS